MCEKIRSIFNTGEMHVEFLKKRLANYPGPHDGEEWKLETDLTKCTPREKKEMGKLGVTVEMLMYAGLNRGEVHHILFGYKYSAGKGRARDDC